MNIANKLTLLRMILIPVVIGLLLKQHMMIAFAIFAVAVFTDFLDGFLARRLGLITNFGKFMDPVADKLLVLSVLMVFVELGRLSSIAVIVIFSRELVISIFRAIAASQGVVIAAVSLGKIKTIAQFIMTGMLFFGVEGLWMQVAVWAVVGLTFASGAEYIYKNRQVLSE